MYLFVADSSGGYDYPDDSCVIISASLDCTFRLWNEREGNWHSISCNLIFGIATTCVHRFTDQVSLHLFSSEIRTLLF